MNLRKVFVPALSMCALLLGGCAQSVDYATFHEKAVEAAKVAHEYTSATVGYSAEGKQTSCELKYDTLVQIGGLSAKSWQYVSGDDATAAAAILQIAFTADTVSEQDDYEYYTTFTKGFRVVCNTEGSEAFYEYESHGLPVVITNGGSTYVIAYK